MAAGVEKTWEIKMGAGRAIQIVDPHKAAGVTSKDSDNNGVFNIVEEERERGYNYSNLRNVRMSLKKLVAWGGWEGGRQATRQRLA